MSAAYDPAAAPDAAAWLALSEDERLVLILEHHQKHVGGRLDERRARAHAALDSAVETQLAQALPAPVAAIARLTAEGLSRSEAVHAIGYVLLQTMSEMLQLQQPFAIAEYERQLEALTASAWRRLVRDGATGPASS